MLVDSYRFLPKSFLPLFEHATPLDGERDPVWAPFGSRLADASIALVTSAGLSVEGEQPPFDLDAERRRPSWGDPTHRVLPHDLRDRQLVMSHLHVNSTDILADKNVAFPVDVLDELVVEGRVERLGNPILHFSYRDIADHVATINRFSSRAAMEQEPTAWTPFKMIANPAWRFFNFYFIRGGFRDGGRGLYAAMTAAFYVFLKYAKLYERRLKSRNAL